MFEAGRVRIIVDQEADSFGRLFVKLFPSLYCFAEACLLLSRRHSCQPAFQGVHLHLARGAMELNVHAESLKGI